MVTSNQTESTVRSGMNGQAVARTASGSASKVIEVPKTVINSIPVPSTGPGFKTTSRENSKGGRERRLTLWLREDLVRRFKVACAELDVPMNAITGEVLRDWLERHENERPVQHT